MTVRVMEGHVLDVLRSLPSNTFQCAATSPPYYGLRDYGLRPQVWGGEQHEHEWAETTRTFDDWASGPARMNDPSKNRSPRADGRIVKRTSTTGFCACGAWLGSLGLEPTPELYVEHLVSVFREVRRVLRPDGVCWVNLGDSYAGSGKGSSNGLQPGAAQLGRRNAGQFANGQAPTEWLPVPTDCKPKDLLGMPWMVAFALRADGWYLRAEIIWSKPNPMPESVTDRPTKAHETVFLLSKSRSYFYDADAIREPHAENSMEHQRYYRPLGVGQKLTDVADDRERVAYSRAGCHPNGRNKRSVWEIATAPFPEAHFATWPPKLVEPMLLAGTSEKGCCPECGKPWERVVHHTKGDEEALARPKHIQSPKSTLSLSGNGSLEWSQRGSRTETVGWRPTCAHDAAPVSCQILDPFAGAGTTLLVASRLGRDSVGIELNPTYAQMARSRIYDDAPLFFEEAGA